MNFNKLTVKAQEAVAEAQNLARGAGNPELTPEHLLIGIADTKESHAARILSRHGVTRDAVLKALQSVRGTQRVTDQNPEDKYQALERYARDLTQLARRGKLDPVIGRDEEIRRVIQVLALRT